MAMLSVWWYLFCKMVAPVPFSWLVIFLPVLTGVLLAAAFYVRTPEWRGAWREIGRRWRLVGWMLLGVALCSYLLSAWLSGRYDAAFRDWLGATSKLLMKTEIKDQIRELAGGIEDKALGDEIIKHSVGQSPDNMNRLVNAWCSTDIGKPVTIYYDSLYWPLARVEEYKKLHDGKGPMIAATGLQYTPAQEELLKKDDYLGLHRSLNKEQRISLLHQFLDPLDQDAKVRLLVTACDFLTDDEVKALRDQFLDKRAEERGIPAQIAFCLGMSDREGLIAFLIYNIRWLRDSLWAGVYTIIGAFIIRRGNQMVREGRPNLFNVN